MTKKVCQMKFCKSKIKVGNTTNFITHLKGKHSALFDELKAAAESHDKDKIATFKKENSSDASAKNVNAESSMELPNVIRAITIPDLLKKKAQYESELFINSH